MDRYLEFFNWSRFHYILLFILVISAFVLRFYLIPQNLFFGPEQGIDFLVIKEIAVNHKFTLIGSKTDIDGIFHGPIYYYLATIPFIISQGNPIIVLGFFTVIQAVSTLFIYSLGKEIINIRTGFIAALIFVVSFNSVIYSRWLSNPPLTIPFSCLFFLFLNRFLKGDKKYLFFLSLMFGLLVQAEFLNLIFFGIILLLSIIIFNEKFRSQKLSTIVISLFILITSTFGNYIFFDMRHDFLITKNLIKLMTGSSGYYTSFGNSLISSTSVFVASFANFIVPFYSNLAIILIISGLFFILKLFFQGQKNVMLILIWLLSPLIILILLKHQVLEHFYISSVGAMLILAAIFIDKVWNKLKYLGFLLLLIILSLNFYQLTNSLPLNKNIIFQSTQPDLKLSDQQKVINKIYEEANKKPFSYQAYTIPYWMSQGWDYLFWHYGEKKYGYMPTKEKTRKIFVIVQDDPNNKNYQSNWLENEVIKMGEKQDEFKIGEIKIQELELK